MSPARALIIFAVPLAAVSHAAPIPVATVQRAAPLEFERDIRPVLKASCTACHNKTTTKAGLNIETPALMKKGGDSGEGLISGKGADSLIFKAAAHIGEGAMPPKGNKVGATDLTPAELGLLKLWIDQGARTGERHTEEIVWQPLPPGLNPIYAVAITPEGDFAACSRANQVFIYHVPSRQLVTRLTDDALMKSGLYKNGGVAHRDLVPALAFSPDGTRLATGSYREVKVWKLTVEAPVLGNESPAADPAAGPPPDAQLQAALKQIDKRPDRPSQIEVARAQRAAGAAGLEVSHFTGAVQQIEAEIKTLDEQIKKSSDARTAAEKSLPEKRKALLAAAESKAAAGKVAGEIRELLAKAPKEQPDEALGKRDKDAREKLLAADKKNMEAETAVKSLEAATHDASAEVAKVTAAKAATEKLLAGSRAQWQLAKEAGDRSKKNLDTARKNAGDGVRPVKLAALSPDQKLLVTAHDDAAVRLWAADTGAPLATHRTPFSVIAALAWRSETIIMATAEDGSTWSLGTKVQWAPERVLGTGDAKSPVTDRVNALRFSPDGRSLIAGSGEPSRSGDITLWDVASGKLRQNWPERHRDSVLSLDWSPDGKLIASGGADRALRILDAASGKQLKVLEGHTHHVLGVAWRSDGRELASAGADNVVKIWDSLTGDRKKNIDGWDKEVTAIFSVGAGDRFVATSGDNKVRVVRDTGGEVQLLPGVADFMESVAVTRDGDVIIAGGQDSKLRLWDAESGKELAVFE